MIDAPPEIFKTRKAAHDWLEAENVPVGGHSKFYKDCERYNLMQPDKTVRLVDLLAYVKKEHNINPATGMRVGDEDAAREKAAEELRNIQLKNAKLERENRKEDGVWMKRSKAYEREGALITQVMGEARFQLRKAVPAAITVCGGDGARRLEVEKLLEESLFEAFRSIYENGEIEVAFEEEEEIDG